MDNTEAQSLKAAQKGDNSGKESLANQIDMQDFAGLKDKLEKASGAAALPVLNLNDDTKAVAKIKGRVIEVPSSDELDSPEWARHKHEKKEGLPGEYVKPASSPRVQPDPRVLTAINQVRENEIKKSIEEISGAREVLINGQSTRLESRSTYGKGYELGLQYFKEKFEKDGYKVTIDNYTRRGQTYQNLRAIKVGNTKPDEVVMFGAHIDSTAGYPWEEEDKAPGADDDGSGAAALSEIAHAMKNLPLDRTVVFSLFSGEEQGLYGSRAMAELYKQAQLEVTKDISQAGLNAREGLGKIIGMYQLDMIGCVPSGNTVESHDTTSDKGSHALTDLLAAKAQQYSIDLKVYGAHNEELTNRSDHYPFYRNGIPAVLLTEPYDTADQPNPTYHSTRDTAEKVNVAHVAKVAKLALAAGVELAGVKSEKSKQDTGKSNVLPFIPEQLKLKAN